jgi:hypothetical protein
MDYGNKAEQLGTSDFWRPETGNYVVTFLSEGVERMSTIYKDTPHEKTIPQVEFKIKINGNEYTWSITEAKAHTSLYGQVMLLGRYHGTLEGKAIHLIVQGDGKKRVYMIQEATELVKKAEEERKAKLEAQKNQPTSSDPFQTPAEPNKAEPKPPEAEPEKKETPAEGASATSDEIYEAFGPG